MALYARNYTTPFLLDLALKNNVLGRFVDEIINAENERILWGIYSQNLPFMNVSFDEFRQNAIESCQEIEEIPTELVIEHSRRLLEKFNPKGGDAQ